MVIHVLADGTRLNDISGIVIPLEKSIEILEILKEAKTEREKANE